MRDKWSIEKRLTYLNDNGARVEYYPAFLTQAEAECYTQALLAQLTFNPEEMS